MNVFSVLKRVKSYLRTRMENDRLSNLILLAAEQEFIKNLDYDNLVDQFANKKSRRYPLK